MDTLVTVECAYCGVPVQKLMAEMTRAAKLGRLPYCGRSHAKRANPSVNRQSAGPFVERFWARVNRSSECWTWTGATDEGGYGKLGRRVEGRFVLQSAHRTSYELTYGAIPDGLWVLHHCDNPPCVRPDHLFLGTAADNTADMIAKGRNRWGAGRTVDPIVAQPPTAEREPSVRGTAYRIRHQLVVDPRSERCARVIR